MFSMHTPLKVFACGALGALIAVAAGAIGTHALRGWMEPRMLAAFSTASTYQMYHSLALMIVSLLYGRGIAAPWLTRAACCFCGGIVLFCGSLFGLALLGEPKLGIITPFGGVLLMLGWVMLLVGAMRHEQ